MFMKMREEYNPFKDICLLLKYDFVEDISVMQVRSIRSDPAFNTTTGHFCTKVMQKKTTYRFISYE